MSRTRTPKAEWVTLGPEPHLCTCTRCGGTCAKPTMPCSITQFVAWTDAFVNDHANCKPK